MIRKLQGPAARITVLCVVFVFCYADVLAALVSHWTENSTYSYGFVVVLISGYIVWTKRGELGRLQPTPAYGLGAVLVLMGMAMLLVGRVGGLMSLQAVSMLLTLAGLILLTSGGEVLRRIRFPLAYLTLALPIWDYVFASLQLPGQRGAATIATALLHAVGVPALHHGTTIELPTVALEVMPECSGINQLLALTTMALPAAYLWISQFWRRACLVGIAVVLGYLSNGLRVAILGWLTWKGFKVSDPHSLIHLAPGFISVALAYVALGFCLNRLSQASGTRPAGSSDMSPVHIPVAGRSWLEATILAVMICAGATQLVAMPSDETVASPAAIPAAVSGWTFAGRLDPATARFAGFDETLLHAYRGATGERRFMSIDEEQLRAYRSEAGREVQLYLGFYRNQANGKELTGDLSRSLQKVSSPLTLAVGPDSVTVREVVERRAEGQRGVVFWYVVNGRPVSNIYAAKLHTLWDAITQWRTRGVAVMVAWDGARNDADASRAAAIDFARALLAQPVAAGW